MIAIKFTAFIYLVIMHGHMIHAKSADLNTIWDDKTDFFKFQNDY